MPAPDWIVHIDFPNTGYGARSSPLTATEKLFLEGRDRAITIAESQDPNASYSYDDWAFCELDGVYYVFQTSGCSCPSPSETWSLVRSGSKTEILEYLQMTTLNEDLYRYDEAFAEFLRCIEAAGWTLLKAAPEKGRTDW